MPRSPLVHDLLTGPPPEVLAEVDAAWERAQELFAEELELSFEVDSLTRQITAALCVPGGVAWESLTARQALAIACGDVAVIAAGDPAHEDRALAA